MRLFFVALLAGLSACASLSESEQRYLHEYDLSRPSGETPEHGLHVIYPPWLEPSDRGAVLAWIDRQVDVIRDTYPWTRDHFDFSNLTVFIHAALDRCVSGPPPMWVHGWRSGAHIFVCWRSHRENGRVTGVSEGDPLRSLPHEIMHIVLEKRFGDSDSGHDRRFGEVEVQWAIQSAKRLAGALPVSPATHRRAAAALYSPWFDLPLPAGAAR